MIDPSLHNPGLQTARQKRPDELSLLYASGAAEHHTTFTQEDVELAAEGLVDGTYQMAALARGYMWIRVEAGDKMDGRYTVKATRPDPDKLRFFTAKASPRYSGPPAGARPTGCAGPPVPPPLLWRWRRCPLSLRPATPCRPTRRRGSPGRFGCSLPRDGWGSG